MGDPVGAWHWPPLGFLIRKGWTLPPAARQGTPCGRCCAASTGKTATRMLSSRRCTHRRKKAFQAPPPKKPGLDEILTWLDAQHIPMAVASSSRMASIRHHLDGWGLTHYFKVIVSGEQFSASNPTRRSFCGQRKRWALCPAAPLCWRTATTACAPVPPGTLSP